MAFSRGRKMVEEALKLKENKNEAENAVKSNKRYILRELNYNYKM